MRRGLAFTGGVGATLLVLAACNAINGASDFVLGEAPAAKDARVDVAEPEPDDGGATGAVACGDQRVCLATPSGWSPVVLLPTAANALCPNTWPQKAPVQAVTGTSKCSCRCAPSFGSGACDGTVRITSGNASCSPGGGTTVDVNATPDGGCTNVAVATLAVSARARMADPVPTSCAPQLAIEAPQPSDVALCSGGEATTSPKCKEQESCVPAVSRGARLCIAKEGEVECPAGPWLRYSTGTNPEDTRACQGCTCAPDPAGCGKGELAFFSQDNCAGANGTLATDDACKTSTVTAASRSVRFRASTGCAVTQEPKVAGALAFTGARTVCCL